MSVPRLRIRTLMIAVAAVAAASSTPVMVQRTLDNRKTARFHVTEEQHSRFVKGVYDEQVVLSLEAVKRARRAEERCFADPGLRREVMCALDEYDEARASQARMAADADYHGRMKQKYSRAAWQPWASVAPDPPDPEDHSPKMLPIFYDPILIP